MKFEIIEDADDYCEIAAGQFLEADSTFGYAHIERKIDHMDYENDEIVYVDRWYVYMYTGRLWGINGCTQFGRCTGYDTKNEAVKVLKEELKKRCQPND